MNWETEAVAEIPQNTHELACFIRGLHDLVAQKITDTGPAVTCISGLSALGKSLIAHQLADSFEEATTIQTDSFQLDREERRRRNIVYGDDPQTINFEALQKTVLELASGNPVEVPIYNHHTGKHDSTATLHPSNMLIIEGACALYDNLQLPFSSLKIFLDADHQTGIYLRHKVNMQERGYTEDRFEQELPRYIEAYERFIKPSKVNADYVCTVDKNWRYKSALIKSCICPHPQLQPKLF